MYCMKCGTTGAITVSTPYGQDTFCEDKAACEARVQDQSDDSHPTEEMEARKNLDLINSALTFTGTTGGPLSQHRFIIKGTMATLMLVIPSDAEGEIRYEYADSCGCCFSSFKVGTVARGIPVLEPEFTVPKASPVDLEPALF